MAWQGTPTLNTQHRIKGRVKWFNAAKGFGFVVSDDPGPDILLHINVLRKFGRGSVAEGSAIELMAQESRRGMQATEVLSIEADSFQEFDSDRPEGPSDFLPADAGPLVPARVKWFDKLRGFGFANVYGERNDIFLHMEVLRQSGLSDLQPGEAVCIRVTEGPRGKMAAEICPWEAAADEPPDIE